MVVPVIFMVAMVAHAAHALKAELVNGTVTVTIEDFEKACEGSRFIHHGEPKKMDDECSFNSVKEGGSTKDTETLFRSMLDKLCPYVGYFPDKEFTKKEEAPTKIDPIERKYHFDDKTTKTTLSVGHSNISVTTTIHEDSLNKTSVLTSTTESIIKPTNKSDEMITDIKFDSYVNETDSILINKTESTSSTPKITEIMATNTTIDKLVILTTEKSIKSITEMTEKTFSDSSVEDTTYNSSIDDTPPITEKENLIINDTITFATETTKTSSNNTSMMDKNLFKAVDNTTIVATTVKSVTLKSNNEFTLLNPKYIDDTPPITEKENLTINDTITFATETTKTTSNNTLMMDKNLFERVDNTTIATTTVKYVTLISNNESTLLYPKYITEESLTKENMTSTTAIEKPISESDIVVIEHELNTDNNETESSSTVPSTSKTTAEVDYYDVDAESEYSTEINKTVVHSFSKDGNTSDYSSDEDTNESSTSYFQHTNDELIVFEEVTDFTTTKHDEDPETTTRSVKTDKIHNYDEDYLLTDRTITIDEEMHEEEYEETLKKFTVPDVHENDNNVTFSSEDSHEISETESTTETSTRVMEETEFGSDADPIHAAEPDVHEKNLNNKVTYEHDPNAVDGRRMIIVIVFASILLVLSLIWAVKVLYRKYQGSYVLPQEGDNDMELGDSSTENSTK